MRAVADTDTFVSGLLWHGPPRQVLDAAIEGTLDLYTSATLLAELGDVVARPKLARRVAASGFAPSGLVERYARLARWVTPSPVEPVVLADPDDDDVIACALGAGADFIVSGDRHLLALRRFRSIQIIGAAAMVALLLAE